MSGDFLVGQLLPLLLDVLVSQAQLLTKHRNLLIPLLQLVPMNLPEVIQLEALHFQDLNPLDQFKESSQVFIQNSLGELLLQLFACSLVLLQAFR